MPSSDLRSDPIRVIPAASVVAGYSPIGTTTSPVVYAFDKPIRVLMVQNLTDALLMFSFDSVYDHFVVPANGFLLVDICTNQLQGNGLFISVGTSLYVKQVGTPTTGSVYATAFYARGA